MVTGKKNLIQGICYIFILSHFAIGFVRFLLGFNTLPLITAERNPRKNYPIYLEMMPFQKLFLLQILKVVASYIGARGGF